ncbi:FkbM family methyltransferase [Oceanibaculum pacificum]|uniref:FkbM family methyltransferase n=1 Tax=Oceanibaculum pacificum TaxID=580166 RepID=UPI000830F10A|nr:FkbM family methyltransferase [Oceanibaculum pacificum]
MDNREAALFRPLASLRDMRGLWPLVDTAIAARAAEFAGRSAAEALAAASGVVLYGAGDFARAVLDAWRDQAVPVRYLVDGNAGKWGSDWQGHPVVSPDKLAADGSRPLVVVAAMDTRGIGPRLEALGVPCLFAERDGSVGFLPGSLLARRRQACDAVFDSLADDRSRFAFLSVVLARLFQDFHFPMRGNLFTDRCATYPQYFPDDILRLGEGECFIDCGAFDGDSLTGFAAEAGRLGLSTWSALGIEADPANAARARANLAALGLGDIAIHEAILGTGREGVGSLHLHNCQGGRIEGSEHSTALDDILADRRPTFIKMDIEGAELPALAGARATIARHRPKLAICTYHTTADLIEIPLFLADNFPFYDLYLRHHRGGSLWETVCYALPRRTGESHDA